MRRKRRFCWLAALAVTLIAACRQPASQETAPMVDLPSHAPADAAFVLPESFDGGWQRDGAPRVFIGQDLFNHIDGAAELFVELGFRRVTIAPYRHGDAELGVELYEMQTPSSARALYYHFRGPGKPVPHVIGRNVGNAYQIIIQKGRYFVQVNNFAGDKQRVPAMVTLANQVSALLPEDEEVELLKLLPAAERVPDSETIVRGPFGMQALHVLGDGDVLQLEGQTFGVAADYRTSDDSTFTRLIVLYDNAADALAAYRHLAAHIDPQTTILHHDDQVLVFEDADERYGAAKLVGAQLDLRLGLASRP